MARVREDLLVRVTTQPIGMDEVLAFVADPGAGGTCAFVGTVRDHSDEGEVTGLTYEAWEDLAVTRLETLGEEMHGRWPLARIAVVHRYGDPLWARRAWRSRSARPIAPRRSRRAAS
jgi:molybdopterin synthase catalytic subunit